MSWEDCNRILRENFTNLQTKRHANVFFMATVQRADESLQEYIYQFSKLVKIVTDLGPHQVTDLLKIIIFNRHLLNSEIKKSLAKGYHRNLKEALTVN